jgi:hypothetical protein
LSVTSVWSPAVRDRRACDNSSGKPLFILMADSGDCSAHCLRQRRKSAARPAVARRKEIAVRLSWVQRYGPDCCGSYSPKVSLLS